MRRRFREREGPLLLLLLLLLLSYTEKTIAIEISQKLNGIRKCGQDPNDTYNILLYIPNAS